MKSVLDRLNKPEVGDVFYWKKHSSFKYRVTSKYINRSGLLSYNIKEEFGNLAFENIWIDSLEINLLFL